MSLPPPTDTYIGEPQYPAPWTTKKPREGLRDNDAAVIVSLAPDVCRSPTLPVPYPIITVMWWTAPASGIDVPGWVR